LVTVDESRTQFLGFSEGDRFSGTVHPPVLSYPPYFLIPFRYPRSMPLSSFHASGVECKPEALPPLLSRRQSLQKPVSRQSLGTR
jgi:hypothetical protein